MAPQLLCNLFSDNHANIKEATSALTHEESIQNPSFGGNNIHWIVGHLVVARCNFMTFLDVPSIWDWPTCKLFIPGSNPILETAEHIHFSQLVTDLDRTQEQLLTALKRSTETDLEVVKEEKSVGEHLAEYAAHEAYHVGQLDILRQVFDGR